MAVMPVAPLSSPEPHMTSKYNPHQLTMMAVAISRQACACASWEPTLNQCCNRVVLPGVLGRSPSPMHASCHAARARLEVGAEKVQQ